MQAITFQNIVFSFIFHILSLPKQLGHVVVYLGKIILSFFPLFDVSWPNVWPELDTYYRLNPYAAGG